MVLSTLWAGFVLANVFPGVARAGDCSIKPLVLPIRNVTFPDGIGANRGIKIVLGGQIQGMRMSTIVNNTRVRNILDCPTNNSSSLVGCEGSSGSVYSTTEGSFDQVFNLKDWNVTVIDPQPDNGATTVVQGYDVANFTDGPAVVSNYPIEVWADHNALNMSALALGPKSSTLERFVDNGLAPSTTFSIDFGSRSELYPRDGQVIFGGVNEARFNHDLKAEFPLWGAGASVNCPLQVLISDVILTNADGNHSLFNDADSKVSACIDTIQNAFTFTTSMFVKFQTLGNYIGFDGSIYGPQSYPADSEPLLGTLTIRLANGYESVIPHYELISHERGTNSQGKFAVVNNSRIQAAVASGLSDLGDNVPILGGVFLSQNYLHVDYEAGKFWLSPQVANGTLEDRITTTCTGSSTNSTTSQSSQKRNLALKISLPIAACCVVLALLGGWLFLRNRKRGTINQSAGATSRSIKQDPSSRPDSKSSTSRLGGYGSHRPTELEGDHWPVPEIHGKELQEESPAYATYFTESPRIGKQDPYYGFPHEGEAYELPDTSPAPCRLSNRGIDSHKISRNDTLQTEVSEASRLNSAKVIPSPISQISSI